MRKYYFFVFVFLSSFLSINAQERDSGGFDYVLKNGYKVLSPTWNNASKMISKSHADFISLMSTYNYDLGNGTEAYIKRNGVGQPLISIEQDDGFISFIWIDTYLSTEDIAKMVSQFFISKRGDVSTYKFVHEESLMTIQVDIKNNGELGGFLLVQIYPFTLD